MPPTPAKSFENLKPGTTHPCPGCGRPVMLDAALCTHCGQQIGKGEQIQTKLGRAEKTGLPPIPERAPGPAAFRDAPKDHNVARTYTRSVLFLAASLAIVLGWKAAADGPAEAIAYLTRYGITLAYAWLVVFAGAMTFADVDVPLPMAALGIATAVAMADCTQHVIHSTLFILPLLAWALALLVCMMVLYDIVDIEVPDAAILTFFIYLGKVVLKFTLFAAMFDT